MNENVHALVSVLFVTYAVLHALIRSKSLITYRLLSISSDAFGFFLASFCRCVSTFCSKRWMSPSWPTNVASISTLCALSASKCSVFCLISSLMLASTDGRKHDYCKSKNSGAEILISLTLWIQTATVCLDSQGAFLLADSHFMQFLIQSSHFHDDCLFFVFLVRGVACAVGWKLH